MSRIIVTLHEEACTFMIASLWIILRMWNVSAYVVEEIKTWIVRSVTFFKIENHALYEMILKNVVEPDRP
jgi:hypothetical protein